VSVGVCLSTYAALAFRTNFTLFVSSALEIKLNHSTKKPNLFQTTCVVIIETLADPSKLSRAPFPPVPAHCVVTGSSGFVGQRLVEMLVERGAKTVVAFDIAPKPGNILSMQSLFSFGMPTVGIHKHPPLLFNAADAR